ncbi:MAG: DUF58 domain-containing protein [Dehalococcoidia bacterium]|nr:DUF58 domain-containing protein [Dehalococcoidia bacterium]
MSETFFRIYPVVGLIAAVFLSPSPYLSFVPLALLVFYLYLRMSRRTLFWAQLSLLTDFFLFFALALLFQPLLGLFAVLVPLPMLGALSLSLEEVARLSPAPLHPGRRRPSNVSLTLFSIAALILLLSFPLGNQVLSLTSTASLAYLLILLAVVLRGLPPQPVEEERVKLRLVAGTKGDVVVKLVPQTAVGGKVFLSSPCDWIRVNPEMLTLHHAREFTLNVSVTPPLSGPSEVVLGGEFLDRWGLIESAFDLNPVRLYVIPRARYLAWLARKYLEGTNPGALPLLSTSGVFRAAAASRTGVEYYGNRPYQAGDSMKSIDWKHSAKLNELVSKEFSELKGQPALILINLAVTDNEEADKLACNIIATALSLAQESIPSALTAYDQDGVRLTTPVLPPRAILTRALGVAERMVSFVSPLKYLAPPDVARLRADLFRLRSVESDPAKALASLLEIEYRSLEEAARESPATAALLEGLAKGNKESNLVVISGRNHDAEALAFNLFKFSRRGYAIIEI